MQRSGRPGCVQTALQELEVRPCSIVEDDDLPVGDRIAVGMGRTPRYYVGEEAGQVVGATADQFRLPATDPGCATCAVKLGFNYPIIPVTRGVVLQWPASAPAAPAYADRCWVVSRHQSRRFGQRDVTGRRVFRRLHRSVDSNHLSEGYPPDPPAGEWRTSWPGARLLRARTGCAVRIAAANPGMLSGRNTLIQLMHKLMVHSRTML